MKTKLTDEESAEISMSPLIDCVFLLLIFFLVSTMMKKEDKDIDIELPSSKSAEKMLPDDDDLVIGIDEGGTFYYEGEETTVNLLHSHLRDIAIDEPDKRIRLDADQDTPAEKMIEVLNICQFRDLRNVGIRTHDENYNKK